MRITTTWGALLLVASAYAFVPPREPKTSAHLFYSTGTDNDYYHILGIRRDATPKEVHSAYRRLAKEYHPDMNPDGVEQFHHVSRAYQVLNDPTRRRHYDLESAAPHFGSGLNAPNIRQDYHTASPFGSGNGYNDPNVRRKWSPFSGASDFPADFDPSERPAYGSRNGYNDPNAQSFDTRRYDPNYERQAHYGQGVNFGDAFARGRMGSRQPMIGKDIFYNLEVDFNTAVFGGEETIVIPCVEGCDLCLGQGFKAAGPCTTCNGCGVVFPVSRTQFSTTQPEEICPTCHGIGETVEEPCSPCNGRGFHQKTKEIKVPIPAGVADFTRLRVRGEGEINPHGGPPGDLIVTIKIKEHPIYRKMGADIHSDSEIDIIDALLGTTIECPVIDGEVTIQVPPGTKSGQGLRVRGNGAPKLGQPGTRGDHIVIVSVEIPKKLSKQEKAIFEQLKKLQDLRKEHESSEVKELEAAKEEKKVIGMKEVEEEQLQNSKDMDEDNATFGGLSP